MIISSVTICEYNSIFFICTKKGMTLEWKSCGKNYIMPFLLDLMSHTLMLLHLISFIFVWFMFLDLVPHLGMKN